MNALKKLFQEATKAKMPNVEFRLGEIEHIPAADNSVDVIMSNCVLIYRRINRASSGTPFVF